MSVSNLLIPNNSVIYTGGYQFDEGGSTLGYYESYNAAPVVNGIWPAAIIADLRITRVGSNVSLRLKMETAANATIASIIGLSLNIPTRFLPADTSGLAFPCQVTNNGATCLGMCTISSTGLFRVYATAVVGAALTTNSNFTISANPTGFSPISASWSL